MNINTQYESTKRCDTYTFQTRHKGHKKDEYIKTWVIKIDLGKGEEFEHAFKKLKSIIRSCYSYIESKDIELVKFE